MNGVVPLSRSYDTLGIIGKNVRDAKILFNILSDNNNNNDLDFFKKIKIGFVYDFNFEKLDNYSKGKIELLISNISKLGIKVENIKVPELKEINDYFSLHGPVVNYEAWKYWKRFVETKLNSIDANVSDRFLIGKSINNNSFYKIGYLS